jgi:AcrR family transcriptional regulator
VTTPRGKKDSARKSTAGRVRGDGGALITSVALKAFAEQGYHGVSIRDIAQRADMSLSALYHYYPGKQDLLYSLLQEGIAAYQRSARAALDAAGEDPLAQLDALVRATVEYRARHRVESNLMLSEIRNLDDSSRASLTEPREEATATLTKIISAGREAGCFTTPYPDDARRAVFAMCNAIAQWYDVDGPVTLEELVIRYQSLARTLVGYKSADES